MRALIASVLLLSACGVNDLGASCYVPLVNEYDDGTAIARHSSECSLGLCLTVPARNRYGSCTQSCESNEDCHARDRFACGAGYACAVAVQVGSECCRKLCICRDDLVSGFNSDDNGQVVTPFACDPERNAQLACRNLLDPKI